AGFQSFSARKDKPGAPATGPLLVARLSESGEALQPDSESRATRSWRLGPVSSLTALSIPVDRFNQAIAEAGPCPEAKLLLSPGDVQAAAWLAVWLCRVPAKRALETAQLADHLGKCPNRDLLS